MKQRLGLFHKPASSVGPVVWLHAVSLGEAKAAGFLAAELRKRVPALRVVFTSSTRTGHEEASRSADPDDIVLYPPLDYRWICRRFLRLLRPDLVVILETELWPNLFREVKRSGAGLLVVNGRISDRAFPRYRASGFLWGSVLSYPDVFFVQSAGDAGRFSEIGAPAGRVRLFGNVKYATPPAETAFANSVRNAVCSTAEDNRPHPVLVAGSTMPGEESMVLKTFSTLRQEFPRLLLILAPRHPERCGEVAELVRAAEIPCQRRSEWKPGDALTPGVFVLDTTGELASLYSLATAAFIGGTLVPTGGHNILEPAWFACPTVIGPSMENFREVATCFLEAPPVGPIDDGGNRIRAGAVLQIEDQEGLTAALRYLFRNPSYASQLGAAAHAVLQKEISSVAPLFKELEARLLSSSPALRQKKILSEPAAAGAGRVK